MRKVFLQYCLMASILFLSSCGSGINWKKTFDLKTTKPYASKLVYDHLDELFTENEINDNHRKIYYSNRHSTLSDIDVEGGNVLENEWFSQSHTLSEKEDDLTHYYANWCLVGRTSLDKKDVFALLQEAKNGKSIILAPTSFNSTLLQTLDLKK